MKIIKIILVFFAISTSIYGQQSPAATRSADPLTNLKNKERSNGVLIYLDTLIQENYNKHLLQNAKNPGIDGFRIRIFSDNGYGAKENQLRVRARFLSAFPDINTYNRYEGSYYKIYVGDFRTKRDALKILDTIKSKFPDAFIVEDNILIGE